MIAFTSRQARSYNSYAKYLASGMELMSVESFVNKTRQKECLEDLNRAYDALREIVNVEYLETRTFEDRREDDRHYKLYCGLPYSLCNFRQKHFDEIVALYPQLSFVAQRLMNLYHLRDEVRATPINAKLIKEVCPKTARVEKSIADFMAKAKADYAHGISLMEEFGYMNVTANVHSVVNQYGTRFNRAFYYMDGKLTKQLKKQ